MKIGFSGSSLNNRDILSGSAVPIIGFINELRKDHNVTWLSSEPELKEKFFSPVPIIYFNENSIKSLPKELELDVLIMEVWSSSLTRLAREFSKQGTKVVIWDDNSPYAIYRWRDAAKYADLILTHGEGSSVILQTMFPDKKVEVFLFATDPNIFKPSKDIPFESDVSFVGTNITKRLNSLKYLFFNQSCLLPTKTFSLYGNGWDKSSLLPQYKQISYKGWTNNENLSKIFFNSKISINGTRSGLKEAFLCPSNRIFDVMASGGVLLSDPIPGIEKIFTIDKELLIANTLEEAYSKIKNVLENNNLREEISSSARSAILRSHTWKHRKNQLMQLL